MTETSSTRILHLLKTRGPQTAAVIAKQLDMTSVGARKHLANLHENGLIDFTDEAGNIGRPKRYWSLTDDGHKQFPDTHEFLTLELISAARRAFGDDGLDRLIADRETETMHRYEAAIPDTAPLASKVKSLARLRTEEGYMASATRNRDGSYLLVENHCPICAAAKECQGFCRSELAIFQSILGDAASIERSEHVLSGARRCAYLITPRDAG